MLIKSQQEGQEALEHSNEKLILKSTKMIY